MSRGMCRLPCREGQEDVVQGRPGEADRARLDASGVQSAGQLDQDAVAVLDRDAERAGGDLHGPYGAQGGQGGAGPAGGPAPMIRPWSMTRIRSQSASASSR